MDLRILSSNAVLRGCPAVEVPGLRRSYALWLTPTLGGPPPLLGELVVTNDDPLAGARNFGRYLMFDAELANVTGNPAMSVPFGTDPDGLPVAVHCLGRYGDEATLFRLAAQLEQARPSTTRHPDPPSSTSTSPSPDLTRRSP